jgi:23S rRNA (cytosine1962-C5)-methyltransferase
MRSSTKWSDYQLIDAGDGEKLEQIGSYLIRRPDPVAIWPKRINEPRWHQAQAVYHRSEKGGGHWELNKKIPEKLNIQYDSMSFLCSLTSFKHIGLFPEQAANWDWIKEAIESSNRSNLKVLNLFAYTGAATISCARMDQVDEVVHVDASKGMNQWAKTNLELNQLTHKKVRFLVDDVNKFVQREIRRGHKYDIIILDPPSYGRGPNGELWKIEDHIVQLLINIKQLLTDYPLFVLLNSYTSNLSPVMIHNLMTTVFDQGVITSDEIGIFYQDQSMVLPAGVSGIWQPLK